VNQPYSGTELTLFAKAANWKTYVASILSPYLGPRVLEVGAGLGANIRYLSSAQVREWTALEPDAGLTGQIDNAIAEGELPSSVRVVTGTLQALQDDQAYDAILYIDVVEHIENDAAELQSAMNKLAPGGHLIVLVPAHQFLFSPFDAAIGHFRRYGRRSLCKIAPSGSRLEMLRMVDSVGFFAVLANRALLRTATPTEQQILAWDRLMVPLSRIIDPLIGYRFGKSLIAVWSKPSVSCPNMSGAGVRLAPTSEVRSAELPFESTPANQKHC
jgi:SAM-dependent methyltransferase